MLCARHGLPVDRCPACAARRPRVDHHTSTVEAAADFERHNSIPLAPLRRINGSIVEGPPGPDEL